VENVEMGQSRGTSERTRMKEDFKRKKINADRSSKKGKKLVRSKYWQLLWEGNRINTKVLFYSQETCLPTV
jgi:hypothetical protein